MPIYEYECKNCHHRFEQLQKISEEPPYTCPKCNEPKLAKLISNTSFQLKGTGWYATDFKNKGIEKKEPENKKKGPEKSETK